MRPKIESGSLSAGLGLLGAAAEIFWHDSTYVALVLAVAGIIALIFDIKWENGQIHVGDRSPNRGRIRVIAPQLVMIASAVGLVSGFFWYLKDKSTDGAAANAEESVSKVSNETSYGPKVLAILYSTQYETGVNVGGIPWQPAYSHVEISLRNASQSTLDNFNATISFKQIIAEARIESPLNSCRIAPNGSLTPVIGVIGGGNIIPPEKSFSMSNVSRVVCDKFVPDSELKVTLATISGIDGLISGKQDHPGEVTIGFNYFVDGRQEKQNFTTALQIFNTHRASKHKNHTAPKE